MSAKVRFVEFPEFHNIGGKPRKTFFAGATSDPATSIVYHPERRAFEIDGKFVDQAGAMWVEEEAPAAAPAPEVKEPDGGHQPGAAGGPSPRTRSTKR